MGLFHLQPTAIPPPTRSPPLPTLSRPTSTLRCPRLHLLKNEDNHRRRYELFSPSPTGETSTLPSEAPLVWTLTKKKVPNLPSSGLTLTYCSLTTCSLILETPTMPISVENSGKTAQPYEVVRLSRSQGPELPLPITLA